MWPQKTFISNDFKADYQFSFKDNTQIYLCIFTILVFRFLFNPEKPIIILSNWITRIREDQIFIDQFCHNKNG